MTTAHAKADDTSPAADANDRIRKTVRALRSAYDVDVPVLARFVGISRNTLYNRLNGMGPFSGGELVRIAEFFDTTVQAICDGSVTISPGSPPSMGVTGLHTRRSPSASVTVLDDYREARTSGDDLPIRATSNGSSTAEHSQHGPTVRRSDAAERANCAHAA